MDTGDLLRKDVVAMTLIARELKEVAKKLGMEIVMFKSTDEEGIAGIYLLTPEFKEKVMSSYDTEEDEDY